MKTNLSFERRKLGQIIARVMGKRKLFYKHVGIKHHAGIKSTSIVDVLGIFTRFPTSGVGGSGYP